MRAVELPGFARGNLHDIPEQAFELAAARLQEAGVGVYCFASTIANWSAKLSDPFQITLDQVRRCIPRMQHLGANYVRIMSLQAGRRRIQDAAGGLPPGRRR